MLVPELVLLRDIDFEVDHGTCGVVRGRCLEGELNRGRLRQGVARRL